MDEFGTGAPGPDPLSGGAVILVNVTVGGFRVLLQCRGRGML